MPLTGKTLAEMQKYDTESFAPAVVDEIINRDPVLPRVPYITLGGTQFRYLRESTLPEPEFYDLDEELVENTSVATEVTVTLKRIGQNSDMEGFATTLESKQSQRSFELMQVAKGMLEKVGERLIYADNSNASKEFDGLQALMPAAQRTAEGAGATGSALNLLSLNTAIDDIRNGRASLLSVPSTINLQIGNFVNAASAHPVRYDKNEFGTLVKFFDSVPLEVNDRQVQTETIATGTYSAKTGGATATIFGLQFGLPTSSSPGIFGLQGPRGLSAIPIGWLHGKDKWRDRLLWELSFGLGSTKAISAVDGITDATVVA